ncbi:hypothetical protein V5799_024060 [Amblyomma americanum]|uniref:Uncharacterized protein n=1 Tax=Amblyomma americanum TaxID=6943 RepID=A0AAQ4ED56_AMBAM
MNGRTDGSLLYGRNTLELEVEPYTTLLFRQVLHPFYVFQIASIIVWILDLYYVYAACIIVVSVVSIALALHETRKASPFSRYRSRSRTYCA